MLHIVHLVQYKVQYKVQYSCVSSTGHQYYSQLSQYYCMGMAVKLLYWRNYDIVSHT